jgi:sugar phosphate isomerase/epimerase
MAGITFSQVHGIWPTDDTTEEKRKVTLERSKRAVMGAAALDGKYLIVHPIMPYGWGGPEDADVAERLNAEFLTELCAYAEGYGIDICLENMPFRGHRISTMDRIVEVLDILHHPKAGICFDTGHALVFDHDLGDAVRLAAPYLKCLHVHDNDGTRDAHRIPFHHSEGKGNWNNFVKALAKVGYNGVMSLECMGDIPDVPLNLRKSYEKLTYDTGRYLADAVETLKKNQA